MFFIYRTIGSSKIEQAFLDLFYEEFLTEEHDDIYIISPWITPFSFSKKIVVYPYIVADNIVDVLLGLVKIGVKVKILTRCIDDLLPLDKLYLVDLILQSAGDEVNYKVLREIYDYLINDIKWAINRMKAIILLSKSGIEIRYDVGEDLYSNRLHSKMYVGSKKAIIGSANLTQSGIVDNRGNKEFILVVDREEPLYEKIREAAIKYFEQGYNFERCEKRIIRTINRILTEKFISLNDFMKYMERVLISISPKTKYR